MRLTKKRKRRKHRTGKQFAQGHTSLHAKPSLGASCPTHTNSRSKSFSRAFLVAVAGSLEPSPDLVAVVILLPFVGH